MSYKHFYQSWNSEVNTFICKIWSKKSHLYCFIPKLRILNHAIFSILSYEKHTLGVKTHRSKPPYLWFPSATAKICWYWWKWQFWNRCRFLTWNKNFMKIIVHIIWLCKHSHIKFGGKNQFCKYVKNYPKIKGLTQFSDIF